MPSPRERSPRTAAPNLVMDDPLNVAAHVEAGQEHAVMASIYLFYCADICEVIRPDDTVVDLACGPANQLAMVARLNSEKRALLASICHCRCWNRHANGLLAKA